MSAAGPVAALKQLRRLWRANLAACLLRRGATRGRCPICARATLYFTDAEGLVHCLLCFGIARRRALVHVLETRVPRWRELRVYEPSPAGAASDKLARECRRLERSHYWPDLPPGRTRDGCRCEDLEALTYPDASFDLVVTQDILEHVFAPERAFAEIARVLAPGGAHVFTVPYRPDADTATRARLGPQGVRHLLPPVYHLDPLDPRGSLVVTDWGRDLPAFIARHGGLATEVIALRDLPALGIGAEPTHVFISRRGADAGENPSPGGAENAADGGGRP